nr:hypothetical protein [Roseovarius sp. W115]MDV2928773.1 hypothetical protein [Roseovarius sp. W115]
MRLSQLLNAQGQKIVCATDDTGTSRKLADVAGIRELAMQALQTQTKLTDLALACATEEVVDLVAALDEGRVLTPIDHPDPAHLLVSGSGLSHKAWVATEPDHGPDEDAWPDHFKTLMLGQRGGKPAPGEWGRSLNGSSRAMATSSFHLVARWSILFMAWGRARRPRSQVST